MYHSEASCFRLDSRLGLGCVIFGGKGQWYFVRGKTLNQQNASLMDQLADDARNVIYIKNALFITFFNKMAF